MAEKPSPRRRSGGDILAGCNFFFTDIMDAYLALPGGPQTT
jgi:hypothetical protein